MACRGTRSRVDGEEMCTVCLEPLPLPGPGADVVLVLHACGHCFHRDCAQRMLLASLRKHQKPRCPNCRATLATAPFGTLLGQRKQPREKRMRNMRELLSVSEDYMKSKNWRVPRRNPHGSTEAQRSLAKLIIQTRSAFKDEFGCEP
ncbi:uncharacterized protein MICPUCDRAFT_53199 [Micromonas pusilla CCMP1545]|uniref:Predicted protein n=1 Tax=Micromonas pusilla (strain CCMP1545) TaxID=564608 RepID=C1N691_MICPC|nr:uncharacterized protein MICPUCDRAFT_53199 [Micromonas pusilla CCMP1545]EEH52432.1 predicted protein [Micromonas pusilla CCMP1545]|eukprot:XP_003063296.1 predicted protein [Micromonas pusilla CCMP1545]